MCEAVIAVCSTVIGTIVGWILGSISLGRLHVSLSGFDELYYYTEPYTTIIPGKKDHEIYNAKLSFKIRLYNSSSISRPIRDCVLEIFDESNNLIEEVPIKDEDSQERHSYAVSYKNIDVVNVPAYESSDIQAAIWIDDTDKMYRIKRIRFRYSDAKFKKHYLKYKTIDFQKVPRFRIKNNGGKDNHGQNENGNARPDGGEH